ncbi:thioredoxin family protein [Vibrio sp. CAU 1672]|uniref:thioredoxin family protein n=1 Tax=Vibrio sp. CAU 1672 TaxID=3032594 RepID=UPI0023DA93FB|nr:thioredoxin family protein [Vibrio sp. CAU 1672]MDF2153262.1 thioredoxin family protein [Vibrio sp. CAU 1672]
MKVFKVLGSGCTNCVKTAELIEQVAQEHGIDVHVDKVTDMEEIMNYDVLTTPAVVMDGQVMHSGSVPTPDAVLAWLKI